MGVDEHDLADVVAGLGQAGEELTWFDVDPVVPVDVGRGRGGIVEAFRSLAAAGAGLTALGIEGDLLYAYDMAAMGQQLQPHLWAQLTRV